VTQAVAEMPFRMGARPRRTMTLNDTWVPLRKGSVRPFDFARSDIDHALYPLVQIAGAFG
jgi:hypothetical protein